MLRLNLDLTGYRHLIQTKQVSGKPMVFDPVRTKYISMQPEEWVRQLFLQYLITDLQVSRVRIAVEKQFQLHGMSKRSDIVIYDPQAMPYLLVECKSPDIPIRQAVFEQASRYNLALRAPYLVVTNGLETYCCQIHFERENYSFIDSIPSLRTYE